MDAYQESIDKTLYIRQAIEERLSPEAVALLGKLLDIATFQHEKGQPADVGHVYTEDAFPAASDVHRSAWVELCQLVEMHESE